MYKCFNLIEISEWKLNMNFAIRESLFDKISRLFKHNCSNFHSLSNLTLETFKPLVILDMKLKLRHYHIPETTKRYLEFGLIGNHNNQLNLPKAFCIFYSTTSCRTKWNSINPINLFDVWQQLERLKQKWDPSFDVDEFKFGVKEALCTTLSLIEESLWNELRGLLILPLLDQLPNDENLLKIIKKFGKISTNDISSTQIIRVALQEIVEHKYCDIDVEFKLKPAMLLGRDALEIDKSTKFIFRFHREYTRGKLPQWTITKILVPQL